MNWQTIVVLAVVVILFAAIVIAHFRRKKQGKTSCSCGGGCDGCAMKGSCRH